MPDEGFRPTLRAIERWDAARRNELRKELRASGEMIASGARLLAAAHSKETPPTIKVRTRIDSKQVTVEIHAGAPDVPIGGLLEMGNKRGGKHATKFRHPVFAPKGSRGDSSVPWVDQPMHPYLAPMVKARRAAVTKRISAAVSKSVKEVHLG